MMNIIINAQDPVGNKQLGLRVKENCPETLSCQESTSPAVYQVEPGCYPAKKAPPRQYTRWNLDVILPRKHLPDSIPGGTWMLSCQESTSPAVYQVEPECYPAKKAPPRQYTRWNLDVILPRKHLPSSIPGGT